MSKQYVILFVLALLMVGFGAYKIGDYYGFEAGQKYGYGLDCRDDLENIKGFLTSMEVSLESAKKAAYKYDDERKSERELYRARLYNELRPRLLKENPDDVLLNAIENYDDRGNPQFNDDYLKCLGGVGPCKR